MAVQADAVVLALGGASWPRLGSDGALGRCPGAKPASPIAPLRPANCGFVANWSEMFRDRFEGQPLKRIALSFGGQSVRGEAIITRDGLEGGAHLRAVGAAARRHRGEWRGGAAPSRCGPMSRPPTLQQRLEAPRGKQSLSNFLRKAAKLSPAAIGLLHEAAASSGRKLGAMGAAELAALIKAVPVRLTGTAPLARAISTAGGIAFDEIDENFMLRAPSRRLRRRRNAGLGSADRRLPAAGVASPPAPRPGAGRLAWLGR